MVSNGRILSVISSFSLAAILSLSVLANAFAASPINPVLSVDQNDSKTIALGSNTIIQQDKNGKNNDHGNQGKGNNSQGKNTKSNDEEQEETKGKSGKGKGDDEKQNDNKGKGHGKKIKIKAERGEGGKVSVEEDDQENSDTEDLNATVTKDDEGSTTFPADFLLEADGGIAIEKGRGRNSPSGAEVSLSLDVSTIRVEGNHLRVAHEGNISIGDTEYQVTDGKGIIIFFNNPGKNFFRGIIHLTGVATDTEEDTSAKLHLRAILLPSGDGNSDEGKWKFIVAPAAKLGPKLRIISLVGELTQLNGDGGTKPPKNPKLDHFVISRVPSSIEAGKLFNITVTAVDSDEKTLKSYLGNVRVSDLSGTVSPDVLIGFKDGVFKGKLNITKATSADKLTFTDVSSGKKGSSNTFDVVPSAIKKLELAPAIASVQPGNSANFTATLKDEFGNTISPTGKAFTWSLSISDYGSISTSLNKAEFTAASSVTVERNVTLTVRVNITSSVFVQDSSKITINPTATQALDHFVIAQISGIKTAGVAFPLKLTAIGTDGQPVVSYAGTIVLTDTTGTLQIVTNNGFSNGVWNGTVKITNATTNAKISVKDSASPSKTGTSNAFEIRAAALNDFVISGIGNNQVAGDEFEFNVTAIDAFGNVVKGYNGTVTLSTNDGQSPAGNGTVISPSPYLFIVGDSGIHEFSAKLYNAKSNVTITVTGSGKDETSNKFTVHPADIDNIIVTPDSVSVVPATNVTFSAYAQDQFGNNVTASADTFTWSLSSSSLGSLDSTTGIQVKFIGTTEALTDPLVGSITATAGSVSKLVNITITPT